MAPAGVRLNWGVIRREVTGLAGLMKADGLMMAVNREADTDANASIWLAMGRGVDDIRPGDKGWYEGGPVLSPVVVVDQRNVSSTVLNVRIEYDVVSLSPSERLDMCSKAC